MGYVGTCHGERVYSSVMVKRPRGKHSIEPSSPCLSALSLFWSPAPCAALAEGAEQGPSFWGSAMPELGDGAITLDWGIG